MTFLRLLLVSPYFCAVLSIAAPAGQVPNVVQVEGFAGSDPSNAVVSRALGFMVEKDGFLLTVFKRLVHPDTGDLLPVFRVTLTEGETLATYDARVIGVEPTLDFALLKIEREQPFEVSKIGHGQPTEDGLPLRAFPNFGASPDSLCTGRLLALNSIECYQENMTQAMYSADIDIPVEAVGTPVFTDVGEVFALFTGYEPPHAEGEDPNDDRITHLLPVPLIFNIYNSIKQRESLASPWTGFSVRRLTTEEQRQFPLAEGTFTGGIALEHIWKNSPAEAMGLKVGDILVRFAYNPIHTPADFQQWLYLYGVGRGVELYLARDGQVRVYQYTIEERPEWAVPR